LRILPQSLESAFDDAGATLDQQIANVIAELEKLDTTLVEAARRAQWKMKYQLERLRGRAARAELRRNEEISRHAQQLSAALYPNKFLQEREYPGIYFLARYPDFMQQILEQITLGCPDHQLLFL
jgi:hypothetical protein